MQQISSEQIVKDFGPPIVYCPTCNGPPMAIKALITYIFRKSSRAVYVCTNCRLEASEPFQRKGASTRRRVSVFKPSCQS
jgi:hypothetical protein